jgi:hypothetical protein
MLLISFLLIYFFILKQNFILSNQKPFKLYFHNSLAKQNDPLFNEITSMSLSNQDIFNYYYKHNVITKLCIGTPKNCFNIEISFSSKYSWICGDKSKNEKKNNYIFSKSSSFKNLNQEESIMTSQGIKSSFYSEDKVKIEDNTLQFFKFFLVEECKNEEFGELSLGIDDYYKYNNTYLSFIEQLNEKKIIDNKIISIRYINNTFGEILLGINYDKYKNKYLDFNIPSNLNSIVQSKDIKSIYYLKQITNVNDMSEEETIFEKKTNIQFLNKLQIELDFSSSVISFPEEIFDNLIDIAFVKYIHNKKLCEIKEDINPNIKYLICDKKILNTNLEKLVIVLCEFFPIQIYSENIPIIAAETNSMTFLKYYWEKSTRIEVEKEMKELNERKSKLNLNENFESNISGSYNKSISLNNNLTVNKSNLNPNESILISKTNEIKKEKLQVTNSKKKIVLLQFFL